MTGLGLLIGHLLGDYILQDDWLAANKTNPHPGPEPKIPSCFSGVDFPAEVKAFEERCSAYRRGHLACALHCTLYTLAVWACSFWWLPWWGLLTCWLAHFPVDRWRLARVFMRWTNHEKFATGPLAPWSIIVVDNTIHLLVLFAIGLAAGGAA